MNRFRRFLKYSLALVFLYAVFNISVEAFQVFYYEDERAAVLEKNKDKGRLLTSQFFSNADIELTGSETEKLLFAIMLMERNPEGLSQLEMLFHAHDLPLLFEANPEFPGADDLKTLYQNYRSRLAGIGSESPYVERRDLIESLPKLELEIIQDVLVLSDFQMRDEESPFLLYPLKPYFPTSYYPANPHVPYVVEDSIRTLKQFEKSEQREIDLALFTGDITDNGHYNEVRWGIDVLDGSLVNPDSGMDDDIFPGLFADGGPNDTSDPFFATGMEDTPWYFVPGNHDGLAMGVFHMSYEPLDLIIAELEKGTYRFMNEISLGDTNYMGNIPNIRSMLRYWWSEKPWLKVPADNDRRLMNPEQIAREMFNSFSKPHGHGMQLAVDIENNRSYSFTRQRLNSPFPIRHIALDTNTIHPQGEFNDERLQWLQKELQSALENRELVVVSSHHTPADIFDNGDDLIALLNSYPNVIAHLVAHRHKNAIRARVAESAEKGYWEIESGSMVNWPQQFRLLEINVDKKTGYGMIESTMLNHHNPNPLAVSERGRFLAYLEAYFHGGEAKLVNREGLPGDRNARLYFKLPESFTDTSD